MTDPIIAAARFLGEHLKWMRHRPEADEFLTDVEAAVRIVRGIVRGPAEQRYLGPCGAILEAVGTDDGRLVTVDCTGDVYGYLGADKGTCRTCGARVDQGERRAWLDSEVRSRAFRAYEIADAYGLNVNTIRSWALDRADIGRPARLHAKAWDRDGRPLYVVGDVLDLAAADAARREENRAKRERRKEQVA